MSDIHVQISQGGLASVYLSHNFLGLPLEEQVKELQGLLHAGKTQPYSTCTVSQTAFEVRMKILESLILAMKEGMALHRVGWKVKGPIETLTRDITQEYWLRRND